MDFERKEENYNYLSDYREDRFAESHGIDPITFNDGNVAKIEILQEVRGWDQSKIDGKFGKGSTVRFHKYLVKCPKHGEFFTLIEDDPRPWSYQCYHCITDEINRVGSARYIRDSAFWKSRREVGR